VYFHRFSSTTCNNFLSTALLALSNSWKFDKLVKSDCLEIVCNAFTELSISLVVHCHITLAIFLNHSSFWAAFLIAFLTACFFIWLLIHSFAAVTHSATPFAHALIGVLAAQPNDKFIAQSIYVR
jgi:hypothetical protein